MSAMGIRTPKLWGNVAFGFALIVVFVTAIYVNSPRGSASAPAVSLPESSPSLSSLSGLRLTTPAGPGVPQSTVYLRKDGTMATGLVGGALEQGTYDQEGAIVDGWRPLNLHLRDGRLVKWLWQPDPEHPNQVMWKDPDTGNLFPFEISL